jgi:AP-4 complex subunit mu-1
VIKDFCGVLTEDAIRKNFILIYEILDEMLVPSFTPIIIIPQDFGHLKHKVR